MNPSVLHKLEPQYEDLQRHIDLLAEGQCKITDVKARSAPFGIYREKDGTYMCRVRRNAGQISVNQLHDLAQIMKAHEIGYAHFSTRQNIQLHGVPGKSVLKTIQACNQAGMIFLGGGGNTFRSIRTSPQSGVSPTEAFDVIPHVHAIWEWISTYEHAFEFGRKFKMGISSEPTDDILAGIQDLGFVAKLQNGERGFKVYCGGGMGRDAALGAVMTDFLPEQQLIKAVQAATDLFYEHGNRTMRSKARLRFLLQDQGEEAFRQLFFQYLEKATAPDYTHQAVTYPIPAGGPVSDKDATAIDAPIQNTSHGDEIKSTKLVFRQGNLNAGQLEKLATLLSDAGIEEVRATPSQDMIIPLVHRSNLSGLFNALKERLPELFTPGSSFDGRITSCIGASACSVGLLDTNIASAVIEKELTQLMAEFSGIPDQAFESVIQGIHISGCASSCGLNQVSPLGFHGHKKRVDGEVVEFYQLHLCGRIDEGTHQLALTDKTWLVEAKDIGTLTTQLIRPYLRKIQTTEFISLNEFIFEKRSAFLRLENFSLEAVVQIIEE